MYFYTLVAGVYRGCISKIVGWGVASYPILLPHGHGCGVSVVALQTRRFHSYSDDHREGSTLFWGIISSGVQLLGVRIRRQSVQSINPIEEIDHISNVPIQHPKSHRNNWHLLDRTIHDKIHTDNESGRQRNSRNDIFVIILTIFTYTFQSSLQWKHL